MSYISARPDIVKGQPLYLDGFRDLKYNYIGPTNEGELFILDSDKAELFHRSFCPSFLFSQLNGESERFYKSSLLGEEVRLTDLTEYEGDFSEENINEYFTVEEEGENWVKIDGKKIHKTRVKYRISNDHVNGIEIQLAPGDIFTTAHSISKDIKSLFVYIGSCKAKKINNTGHSLSIDPASPIQYISPSASNSRIICPNIFAHTMHNDFVTRSDIEEYDIGHVLGINMNLGQIEGMIDLMNERGIPWSGFRSEEFNPKESIYNGGIPVNETEIISLTDGGNPILKRGRNVFNSFGITRNSIPRIIEKSSRIFGSKVGIYRIVKNGRTRGRVKDSLIELSYLGKDYSHITSVNSMISELYNTRGVPSSWKERNTRNLLRDTFDIEEYIEAIPSRGIDIGNPLRGFLGPDQEISHEDPGPEHHFDKTSDKISNLYDTIVRTKNDILRLLREGISSSKNKNISEGDTVKCKKPDNKHLEKGGKYTVKSIDSETIKNKKMVWIDIEGKEILSDIRNFKKVKHENLR